MKSIEELVYVENAPIIIAEKLKDQQWNNLKKKLSNLDIEELVKFMMSATIA